MLLEREYALKSLNPYWSRGEELIARLPIPALRKIECKHMPPQFVMINLPQWGYGVGVKGQLLVPVDCLAKAGSKSWQDVDWLSVIFWYLHSLPERLFERTRGVIHSYSYRLTGWDQRMWERAWVNRIALFLRKWACQENDVDETQLFGALPRHEIMVTHDVDAIEKTWAIRFKQSAFNSFNSVLYLLKGKIRESWSFFCSAMRFFFAREDYWLFDEIKALEDTHGLKSHFNFYAGTNSNLKERLFDPNYDIASEKMSKLIHDLQKRGSTVGLHQSFDCWKDAHLMREQKERLEAVLGVEVTSCRQHWLRFSWQETWRAQQTAGLELDTTLGFNDRVAFRNSAALKFHPWDSKQRKIMKMEVLPMVMMDSHFYDYHHYSNLERQQKIAQYIEEIAAVGGSATVIWHTHVLGRDYGWRAGFEELIAFTSEYKKRN